jgi:flagellar hook-length control protein FliK
VDLLAELGFAPLPAAPAASRGSSPPGAPAGADSDDFAAHMENVPAAPTAEPARTGPSAAGMRHPSGGLAAQHRDGLSFQAPLTPAIRSVEPVAVAVEPLAARPAAVEPAPADPPQGDAAARSPAAAQAMAAIEPGEVLAPEAGQAPTKDRLKSAEPDAAIGETAPDSEKPILQVAPDPLPARPTSDPVTVDPTEGALAQAAATQLEGGATSGSSDGQEATSPRPTSGADARSDAREALPQALPAEAASVVLSGPGGPAAPAGAASTGRSAQSRAPGASESGRAEARHVFEPLDGADDDGGELPLRAKAETEAQVRSLARRSDESGSKQPAADGQTGRLPHLSGASTSWHAIPQAAAGVAGDLGQFVARTPEGIVMGDPGAHSATRQVALRITKALEHDRTEIRIQLDPPELGEVDIQLEFRDLRLTATVSAERSDTLDLLQRDARTLARSLREAGIELADSDLSFASGGRHDRPDAGASGQRAIAVPHPLRAPAPLQDLSLALARPDGFVSLSDGRMDLRV